MYEEICFIEGFVFGIISGVAVSKMDDDNNSGNVFSRSVLTCIGSWIGYYCVSYLVKSSYYYDDYDEHGLTIFLIMTAFVAIFYVFFSDIFIIDMRRKMHPIRYIKGVI